MPRRGDPPGRPYPIVPMNGAAKRFYPRTHLKYGGSYPSPKLPATSAPPPVYRGMLSDE
jgi:hypothetical protein